MHVADDLTISEDKKCSLKWKKKKKEFRGSPKVLLRLDNPWLMVCISANAGSISLLHPENNCVHTTFSTAWNIL